ncbi:MAG: hypothetical protein CMJ78_15595 [Planctomycetaceae bacterium]|nr:hypothetical protein [Planctomycetaceae bacterium]
MIVAFSFFFSRFDPLRSTNSNLGFWKACRKVLIGKVVLESERVALPLKDLNGLRVDDFIPHCWAFCLEWVNQWQGIGIWNLGFGCPIVDHSDQACTATAQHKMYLEVLTPEMCFLHQKNG